MAAFLYYVSGDRPTVETLTAAGFHHAKDGALPGRECLSGPDGKRGWIFVLGESASPRAKLPALGYFPAGQTWELAYDGAVWIGVQSDARPRPIDLQRKRAVTGVSVKLLDGNEWTVPVARLLSGDCALPHILGLDGGKEVDVLSAEHARLFELAGRAFGSVFQAPNANPLSPAEERETVALALAQNYRVSAWELRALRVLGAEQVAEVILATCDYATAEKLLVELQKKTESQVPE